MIPIIWKNIDKGNWRPGRQIFKPITIVIHVMDGTLAGTDAWFANSASRVSAHYGVSTKEIHQYVHESDTAYHAGNVRGATWPLLRPNVNPNLYTIGIEHEGRVDTAWTGLLYGQSTMLVREICKRWGIPMDATHIIGHHEIYSPKPCPGLWDKTHYLTLLNQEPANAPTIPS